MDFNRTQVPQCDQNVCQYNLKNKHNSKKHHHHHNNIGDHINSSQKDKSSLLKVGCLCKKIRSQHHVALWHITMSAAITVCLLQMPTGGSAAAMSVNNRLWPLLNNQLSSSSSSLAPESESSSTSEEEEAEISSRDIDLWQMMGYGQGQQDTHRRANKLRLRKRHNDYYLFDKFHHNRELIEWHNTCGGSFNSNSIDLEQIVQSYGNLDDRKRLRMRRKEIQAPYLPILTIAIEHEINTLKGSQSAINLDNFHLWSMWSNNYKFLPRITPNSHVKLQKWYREMQKYVGAFAYLGHMAYTYDKEQQEERETTSELHELLLSARSILCEIETAINGSNAAAATANGDDNIPPLKLRIFSRELMNSKLSFTTRKFQMACERKGIDIVGKYYPNHRDMEFAKKYYYDYLQAMLDILYQVKPSLSSEEYKDYNAMGSSSEEHSHGFASMDNEDISDLSREIGHFMAKYNHLKK